jgi:hypothetical protein
MFYKLSGRFSLGGLMLAVLVGSAGSLTLAYIYGWGLPLISEGHFAAFATIAFGGLIGVCTAYGLIWGKVRNQPVAQGLLGAISVIALYISWAVWISFVLGNQPDDSAVAWQDLALHPGKMWEWMCAINQHGTWGLDHASPTHGLELWGMWIGEAACIIGVAYSAGIHIFKLRPFCESCGSWCSRATRALLAAPPDIKQLQLQLEANDLRPLENLAPGNKAYEHLIADLYACERCHQLHTLSLTHVRVVRKWGRSNIDSNLIVQHLLLGAGPAQTLRQLLDKVSRGVATKAAAAGTAAGGKR